MATNLKSDPKRVVTGKVRFSYVHVFEPRSNNDGETPKYSISLLIPKSDKQTVAKIKEAINAAKEDGKNSKFGGKIPANLKLPLRDGDDERGDDPAYEGCYFLNASSLGKPGVVDKALNPILDRDEFYSGCYGRASITFFPFSASGNKGIAAGLNNIQKIADGAPLGGRTSPELDFGDDLDLEDDDLL